MATLEDVAAELRKRQGASMTVACAVDGSQISDRAMDVATSFANTKRCGAIVKPHAGFLGWP